MHVNIHCLDKKFTRKYKYICVYKYLSRPQGKNYRKAAILLGTNEVASLFLSLFFAKETIERKNDKNGEGERETYTLHLKFILQDYISLFKL